MLCSRETFCRNDAVVAAAHVVAAVHARPVTVPLRHRGAAAAAAAQPCRDLSKNRPRVLNRDQAGSARQVLVVRVPVVREPVVQVQAVRVPVVQVQAARTRVRQEIAAPEQELATPSRQPAKSYKRPGSASGNRPNLPNNRPSTGASRPGSTRPGSTIGGRGPGNTTGGRPRPSTRPSSSQLNDFLGTGSGNRPGAGTNRPGSSGRPGSNIQRPGDNNRRPNLGDGNRNNIGDRDRTNIGDRDRTNIGDRNRTNIGDRDRTNIGDRNRTNIGDRDRTNIGDRNRTNIGDRQIGSRDVNVGDINIDKSTNFTQNRQQWVDNRHATGNRVRANVGNRYDRGYRDGAYRRGAVGGYGYHNNWNNNGAFYGWRAPTYAAVGGFLGASLVNTQPVYYAYGSGGNVYYENNTVYVDGQAAGTPEQYAQQAMDYVAAAPAPEQVPEEDWLPLGVFALTGEELADSNAMIELAISKEGVIAGTYYNDATGTSRPLKGTFDSKNQRAAVGFADGNNADLVLETGIYNLTQDEAPALLHHGTEESSSVLLVRLPPPEGEAGS